MIKQPLKPEGRAIDFVSLRQAGRRLGISPNTVHGVAVGLGMNLAKASHAIIMTEEQLLRIKDHIERHPPRRGRPRVAATAS